MGYLSFSLCVMCEMDTKGPETETVHLNKNEKHIIHTYSNSSGVCSSAGFMDHNIDKYSVCAS